MNVSEKIYASIEHSEDLISKILHLNMICKSKNTEKYQRQLRSISGRFSTILSNSGKIQTFVAVLYPIKMKSKSFTKNLE
jgi:hypothetical protein